MSGVNPQAVVQVDLPLVLPFSSFPEKLVVGGLRHQSLDLAIGNSPMTIDIARLDEDAIDALCAQWSAEFKRRWAEKRSAQNDSRA